MLGPKYECSDDLIFFVDHKKQNLIMKNMNIKENLRTPLTQTIKNATPVVYVILK